jgi:hypothetical protein
MAEIRLTLADSLRSGIRAGAGARVQKFLTHSAKGPPRSRIRTARGFKSQCGERASQMGSNPLAGWVEDHQRDLCRLDLSVIYGA